MSLVFIIFVYLFVCLFMIGNLRLRYFFIVLNK